MATPASCAPYQMVVSAFCRRRSSQLTGMDSRCTRGCPGSIVERLSPSLGRTDKPSAGDTVLSERSRSRNAHVPQYSSSSGSPRRRMFRMKRSSLGRIVAAAKACQVKCMPPPQDSGAAHLKNMSCCAPREAAPATPEQSLDATSPVLPM